LSYYINLLINLSVNYGNSLYATLYLDLDVTYLSLTSVTNKSMCNKFI